MPRLHLSLASTLALAPLALAQPIFPPSEPAPPPIQPAPATPVTPRTDPRPTDEGPHTGVPRIPVQASRFEVVHPDYAEVAHYARAEVQGVLKAFDIPGISAAVMVDGQIVWQEGFGFSDVASSRPVTPDTRFRIGSISKPITALAMATLAEAGRLDLDAPIQTYVPSFPEKPEGVITPRLLAGHLSGIRHYRPGEDDTIRPRRYGTMDEALARFASDPLTVAPGTRYRYSTYAYTLLGAAIESAAGEPFLVYLREAVLDPIGMQATSADRSDGQIENLTSFYHRDRESRVIPAPPIDTSYKWAGGGLVSTTGDLLEFAGQMMQPTLISEEFRDQMWTAMQTTGGQSTHYGMGWALDVDERHRRLVSHSGGQVGCTAFLLIFPELDVASVVLYNVTGGEVARGLSIAIAEPFIRRRDELRAEHAEHEAEPAQAEPASASH